MIKKKKFPLLRNVCINTNISSTTQEFFLSHFLSIFIFCLFLFLFWVITDIFFFCLFFSCRRKTRFAVCNGWQLKEIIFRHFRTRFPWRSGYANKRINKVGQTFFNVCKINKFFLSLPFIVFKTALLPNHFHQFCLIYTFFKMFEVFTLFLSIYNFFLFLRTQILYFLLFLHSSFK